MHTEEKLGNTCLHQVVTAFLFCIPKAGSTAKGLLHIYGERKQSTING